MVIDEWQKNQFQDGKSTKAAGGSLISKLFPRPSRSRPQKSDENGNKKRQRVWTLNDKQPQAVLVTTGATSGIMTEIVSGEVTPGMVLIIESVSKRK